MSIGPVMLDIEGTVLQREERELLKHPAVGGLVYFSRNYLSPDQLQALTAEVRDLRPELLIAVDQEGGRVQRFRKGFTPLPAMQSFLPLFMENRSVALSLLRDCGWLMAAELLAVGVDFSFAPVLDVDSDYCQIIGKRAFADDPEAVVVMAEAFIAGMHEAGMSATGKHFPGHGGVTGDSHLVLPTDRRHVSEIRQRDMHPFIQLSSQLDAVMSAHIFYPAVDDNPASFSNVWLQQILRGELQFNGAIFSDDLSMAAAASLGSYIQRAQRALSAGCDMVLICNNRVAVVDVLDQLGDSRQQAARQQAESHRRLTAMSARRLWCRQELQQLDRWQRTHEAIRKLC